STPALTMAFMGQSDAVRRVTFLDSGASLAHPTRFHQVRAAIILGIAICLAGTIGINSHNGSVLGQAKSDEVMRNSVTVVDQDGKPIEGAEVDASNLRTRKAPDAHYGNPNSQKTKTDKQGTALIKYPKFVYEQMETRQVTIKVTHPDFVSAYLDHSV